MAFRLPRFPRNVAIADANGFPTQQMQVWMQAFAEAIEAQEARQDQSIDDIAAALAAAGAADAAAVTAQAAADVAQAAADTAQAAADSVNDIYSLSSSYPDGLTITGSDAGATATITMSAHTRQYGDGTSASVNGGAVTGLAFSTDYIVYYDDPTRAGGAVTYAATTNPNTAAQTGDRHTVGYDLTPADGAGNTTGVPVLPPGAYAISLPF